MLVSLPIPVFSPPLQPVDDNPLIPRFAKLAAELQVVLPSENCWPTHLPAPMPRSCLNLLFCNSCY